ncbi:MAG: HAD family hydrolase, partial [Bacillota bacterium]|nr:HAD family hydrolase [Bacillota bacterium]
VKAPEQFRPGEGRHIFVGDDWWVPLVIGRHYGATETDIGQAFLATRAFQAGPDYELTRNEKLVTFLRSYRQAGGHLALMTNSPQPDSEILLQKLGIASTFDKCIFAAGKPLLTRAHLQSLLQHFRLDPKDAVSIGDNPLNDILPARILGMKTVFIDPYDLAHEASPDLCFPHLDDFLEWVMAEKTAARS